MKVCEADGGRLFLNNKCRSLPVEVEEKWLSRNAGLSLKREDVRDVGEMTPGDTRLKTNFSVNRCWRQQSEAPVRAAPTGKQWRKDTRDASLPSQTLLPTRCFMLEAPQAHIR